MKVKINTRNEYETQYKLKSKVWDEESKGWKVLQHDITGDLVVRTAYIKFVIFFLFFTSAIIFMILSLDRPNPNARLVRLDGLLLDIIRSD